MAPAVLEARLLESLSKGFSELRGWCLRGLGPSLAGWWADWRAVSTAQTPYSTLRTQTPLARIGFTCNIGTQDSPHARSQASSSHPEMHKQLPADGTKGLLQRRHSVRQVAWGPLPTC